MKDNYSDKDVIQENTCWFVVFTQKDNLVNNGFKADSERLKKPLHPENCACFDTLNNSCSSERLNTSL